MFEEIYKNFEEKVEEPTPELTPKEKMLRDANNISFESESTDPKDILSKVMMEATAEDRARTEREESVQIACEGIQEMFSHFGMEREMAEVI